MNEPRPFFRTCAVCLMEIVRSDYGKHMQDVHGYETIGTGCSTHYQTIEVTRRPMNLKGYVSVASPVPVSVQNMVVRAYCERNGHTYSLSDVEFLTGHAMLDGLIADLHSFDGICAYSMWIIPAGVHNVPDDKEFHFALEGYALPRDLEIVNTLRSIREAMK